MSAIAVPLPVDDDDARAALAEYRGERRRKRIAGVDLFDAFYKAYLGAGLGGIAVYGAAGWLGDAPVSPGAVDDIVRLAPHYVGLLIALLTVIAIRSGVRGGPLAFEQAEVRHVLMAPVDRRESMAGPARAHLRHSAFLGMVVGGAAGLIVSRRLPGTPFEWVIAGVAFGVLVGLFTSSVAMIVAGLRTRRWVGDVVAVPLLGWALAGLLTSLPLSPFAWLGTVGLAPLELQWPIAAAVVTVAVVAPVALSLISLSSLEAAERRSRLIGQLRFAATVQDVRTVMVLQRQLAQEHPRNRPLLKLKGARRPFNRKGHVSTSVMTRRSWHNLLRWPYFRYVRVLALTAMVSACVVGIWMGNAVLIVPAGLLLWLVAIDLLEPLAQEADHPSILRSTPRLPGSTQVRLLIVPALVLIWLGLLASVPAAILGPPDAVASLIFPIVVSTTVLALGGAALVVTRSSVQTGNAAPTPEVVGILTVWHTAVPPLLAIAGFVPLVVARAAYVETGSASLMLQEMNTWWYGVLAVGSWAIAWIRYGTEMKANIAAAQARQVAPPPPAEVAAPAKAAPSRNASKKKNSKKGKK